MKLRVLLWVFLVCICPSIWADAGFDFLMEAAEGGDADSQYVLAVIYETGKGVEQSNKEAAKWYTKSAEQGNKDAQFQLGGMYEKGVGVKQDSRQSIVWYTKAAAQGSPEAQNILIELYENGNGKDIQQDYKQLYVWASIRAADGDANAKTKLEMAASKLDPSQMGEAKKLAAKLSEKIEASKVPTN